MCTLLKGLPSQCIMLPWTVILIPQLSAIRWQWWRSDIANDDSSIEISASLKNGQNYDNLQLESENEEN